MEQFNYCVFIGRFSAFHHAHLAIIEHAFKIAKNIIVVIGSANTARTVRNPWTAKERQHMIETSLSEDKLARIKFVHMKDYLYNYNMWVSVLQEKINMITGNDTSVALIGFETDETSYYLKSFPQFKYIEHGTEYRLHATKIRDLYFSHDATYKAMVPSGTMKVMEEFKNTDYFKYLKAEKDYIDKYKESWRGAPFPPIFMTVDSLVLRSGHILVVRRGRNPGKGLLALPGGFVGQMEKLEDAALRELKEETGIKINIPDLKKSITDNRIFDDPMRSARGRVISNAFLINLGTGPLPQIQGGDDADDAFWMPLNDFYTLEDQFFEDHYHIVLSFVSKY